ncbi:MAG TPA: hypothetical protein VHX60_16175 [Acidobacteriaceae bacterium]|jgi:hypothetical protein|nr:hypothetical protein [Acidobacteriaceae bacterium]
MVSRSLIAAGPFSAVALFLSLSLSSVAQTPGAPQVGAPGVQTQNGQPTQPTTGLQLQNLPSDAHTPTPAEEAQMRQEQALATAMRLAALQAHWGSAMSTPGLSMSMVEASRTKAADGATTVAYHVTASGFTPGDSLTLIRWPLDSQAQTVMSGLGLDPNGNAICAPAAPAVTPGTPSAPGAAQPGTPEGPLCTTTMKANDPLVVEATAAPGEPIRVALIDNDRRRGAAAETVPFPIANENQGCKLQILLGMKDASLVLVEGTGFPPNTPLKLESISGGHTRMLNPTTNADGRLVVADLPTATGQASGTATVRFAGVAHLPTLDETKKTPDPTCAPSITFPWGKGTYKAD